MDARFFVRLSRFFMLMATFGWGRASVYFTERPDQFGAALIVAGMFLLLSYLADRAAAKP